MQTACKVGGLLKRFVDSLFHEIEKVNTFIVSECASIELRKFREGWAAPYIPQALI